VREGSVDLPKGWIQATIGELCDLNPKHNGELSDETPVSFVPMAAVSDILGTITESQVRTLGEVRKGYTHFADGDVIFAKITPCMENGKAASVRGMTNGLACGTTEFYVFRSHGAIDQDFLFYFIRQESYRKAARAAMQSGVGQARVPKEFILNTELPLPPLAEQQRIVAKIEALQERSRRAREALSEVGPLLEQFRQSVLATAFRGDLTADWRATHPDVEPASELLQRIRTKRRHC
jgi:type I restriction enzyme, S subunit